MLWSSRTWLDFLRNCFKISAHSSTVVAAIAFSPDGKLIVTARGPREATLWDIQTAAQLQNFGFVRPRLIWKFSFSDDGNWLYINEEDALRLDRVASHIGPSEESISAGVDIRDDWILWKGHRMIWLPSEYRPLTFATRENQAALLCRTGRISIITFDADETEAMLQRLHGCDESSLGPDEDQILERMSAAVI